MWHVVFYETAAGRRPVREYLVSLDLQERRRVADSIDLLETFGLDLSLPHVRGLGDKLWELRTTGQREHRILYFAATGKQLVLLHAFTKKTQKTPQHDIETARRRMADYLERMSQ